MMKITFNKETKKVKSSNRHVNFSNKKMSHKEKDGENDSKSQDLVFTAADNFGLTALFILMGHMKGSYEYKAAYNFFLKNSELGESTKRYLSVFLENKNLSFPLSKEQLDELPHVLEFVWDGPIHHLFLELVNEPVQFTVEDSRTLLKYYWAFKKG